MVEISGSAIFTPISEISGYGGYFWQCNINTFKNEDLHACLIDNAFSSIYMDTNPINALRFVSSFFFFFCLLLEDKVIHRDRFVCPSIHPSGKLNTSYNFAIS